MAKKNKLFFLMKQKMPPILLVALCCLTACSSMDEAPKPHVDYSPAWQYVSTSPAAQAVERQWWSAFGSAHLMSLIEQAHAQNPDIKIATEHVTQAELQMKIADASLFPSLNFSASTGDRRTEINGANLSSKSTAAGFSASYEVDLWGGAMANRHVASAGFRSTQFTRDAMKLSIEAGVANAWFNYMATQERIATANKNIAIAERVMHVVDSLYRNGAATGADVAAQQTNLLTQKNALLPLQLQLDQTRAAIALLLGQVPQQFELPNETFSALNIPSIDAGVPSDLITRRPDMASTEAQLQAASANIYAARAALLPSVNVNGNLGKTASDIFTLSPAVNTAGWSLNLAQTLFAGGRIVNQKRLSESRRVELVELYRKNILTALQETDDALDRVTLFEQQENNQREIVNQAQRNLTLAERKYKEGGSDLLSLLDAQRSLFQAQDGLVLQRLSRLKASVDLYKALGGGWSPTSL